MMAGAISGWPGTEVAGGVTLAAAAASKRVNTDMSALSA